MVSRIVIVGAVIAAVILLGPFSVPNWAVVAFVLVVFLMGIVLSVKRMRAERRLARTAWQALTRTDKKEEGRPA
jgi:hypothetical protein